MTKEQEEWLDYRVRFWGAHFCALGVLVLLWLLVWTGELTGHDWVVLLVGAIFGWVCCWVGYALEREPPVRKVPPGPETFVIRGTDVVPLGLTSIEKKRLH